MPRWRQSYVFPRLWSTDKPKTAFGVSPEQNRARLPLVGAWHAAQLPCGTSPFTHSPSQPRGGPATGGGVLGRPFNIGWPTSLPDSPQPECPPPGREGSRTEEPRSAPNPALTPPEEGRGAVPLWLQSTRARDPHGPPQSLRARAQRALTPQSRGPGTPSPTSPHPWGIKPPAPQTSRTETPMPQDRASSGQEVIL